MFDTPGAADGETGYTNQVRPSMVPRAAQGSIPVIARLVLHDGSEEWWPAKAVRWTAMEVLVPRQIDPTDSLSVQHVWLPARRHRPGDPSTTPERLSAIVRRRRRA